MIKLFGDIDEKALEQMRFCLSVDGVIDGALMADNHMGYSAPIGSVIVMESDKIVPGWVGYDIGCGIRAVRTDLKFYDQSISEWQSFAKHIYQDVISFGIGGKNEVSVEHELFDSDLWAHEFFAPLKEKAQKQLGTIGSGNHFVDFLFDANGCVWIMTHFGSRGFGHSVASGFINLGEGKKFFDKISGEKEGVAPKVYSTETELGALYFNAMQLAGEYAYAGRDWVVETIAAEMGANIVESVHNHHNFAWVENHNGSDVMVIRKGATPLYTDSLSVVGGSMGDISVVISAKETNLYYEGYRSAMHGAGRVMSRTQAAGKLNRKTGVRSGGLISVEKMHDALSEYGVTLFGGGTDESPFVYRSLTDVVNAYDYVDVKHQLRPFVVMMAGIDVFDPYKD